MTSKTKQAFAMIEADPSLTLHAVARAVGVRSQTLYTAKKRIVERAARPLCPACQRPVRDGVVPPDPAKRERERIIAGVKATRVRTTDLTQVAVLDAMLRWLDKP